VMGLSGAAKAVAIGYTSGCALITGGTVQCWGSNNAGQLGNGTTTTSLTAVTVSGLTNATAIAVGELHACALRADGTVVCWGDNGDDQLGSSPAVCTGSEACSLTPVQVSGLTGVTALSASAIQTCASAGGNVYCWGYNQFGLGDAAATTESYTPIKVANLTVPTAVSVGTYAACAVISGGTAACWGEGPLGDGTTNSSATLVPVMKVSTATSIAMGGTLGCVLLSNGNVSCFTSNEFGEAGNGTTTPQLVAGPVVW
jgi:alpha-tubulin suppressor-like RCC1 family protein